MIEIHNQEAETTSLFESCQIEEVSAARDLQANDPLWAFGEIVFLSCFASVRNVDPPTTPLNNQDC